MSSKPRILFLCVHNAARSQMAEALCRVMCGDTFEPESAGLEPGTLNPLAIEVLKEIGLDITAKVPRDVFDLVKTGRTYSYVITVCDQASAERCPIFPGITQRLHWDFPDPMAFEGSWEEKVTMTRGVLRMIEERLGEFCREECGVTEGA